MSHHEYRVGVRDALAKFGGIATTSPQGRTSAISQAFSTNSALGQTSQMEEPPMLNATMRGGSPRVAYPTDVMGSTT